MQIKYIINLVRKMFFVILKRQKYRIFSKHTQKL